MSHPTTKADILDRALQTALDADSPKGIIDRIEQSIVDDIGARESWRVFGEGMRQEIMEFVS